MAGALKTEEIWMCVMWKARGVQWQNAGAPIKMVSPKEGLVLYVSEMGIPKNAPNKEAASELGGLVYSGAAITIATAT